MYLWATTRESLKLYHVEFGGKSEHQAESLNRDNSKSCRFPLKTPPGNQYETFKPIGITKLHGIPASREP